MSRKYKDPMEKIMDAVAQRVADALMWARDYHSDKSPLEGIMAAALTAEGLLNSGNYSFDDIELAFPGSDLEIASGDDNGRIVLHVIPQFKIMNYVADFAVFTRRGEGWSKLVVECDGHDFHERTKEQAAHDRSRDRAMQEAGYVVFRFTGAEIYRDPVKCARQVVSWADKETFG